MSIMRRLRDLRTRRGRVPSEGRGLQRSGAGATEKETGKQVLDVFVTPELKPIPQPSPMTCWAATGVMLKSWQAKKDLSLQEVLDGLGDGWRAKFDAGQGLSATELAAFARALGLVEQVPMHYSVMQLAEILQQHGPIWVISDDPFEGNHTVHLRVVTAIRGDGSPDGTMVTLADSASGNFVMESFAEFARDLQASDPMAFGAGVYHFWHPAGVAGSRDQAG